MNDATAYDWLEDDGRLWFPESLAWWLEPETEEELLSWFRRYRPNFRGKVECAGLTIEVTDPPRSPYADMGLGGSGTAVMQAAAAYAAACSTALRSMYHMGGYISDGRLAALTGSEASATSTHAARDRT